MASAGSDAGRVQYLLRGH